VFNDKHWTDVQLGKLIWESLVDYGRFTWQHTLVEVEKQLDTK